MENICEDKKIFLWLHMHQPCYEIPESNYLYLPWVRRHMLNGYYTIPKLLMETGAKLNINFSGILLKQMKLYEKALAKDIFQLYEEKEAASLSEAEKNFIIKKFLVPLPIKSDRFNYLIEKKQKSESFNTSEILDTQVFFLLSAFAWPEEEILEIRKKEKNFSENDKSLIINAQKRIIKSVIPMYKKLNNEKQIEITISPYYHPVLPLLIDKNSAKESKEDAILPDIEFAYPEDAEKQIDKSIEICKEIFGVIPKGLWPSEGSISNSTIDLIKNRGIEWIGTDELILRKTAETLTKKPGVYKVRNLKVFFRDHQLSDKIAFTYNKMNPEDAVNDLLNNQNNEKDNMKIIILDGENPWIFYPQNGIPFLKELFNKLNKNNSLLGSQVQEKEKMNSIKPGSWINGYFDTWIGDTETNKAWSYLDDAKKKLGKIEKSNEDILMAEGSDFFWWYSNFHRKEVDYSFDYMFRTRLTNAYKNGNKPIPDYLLYPIKIDD
jgi:alpha-amylase/alpha-mannosidase (GH57 family)